MSLRNKAWLLLFAIAAIVAFQSVLGQSQRPQQIAYSELLDHLGAGRIESAEIGSDQIEATLKDEARVTAVRPPALDEPDLLQKLRDKQVKFSGHVERTSIWQSLLLGWILPFAAIFLIYAFVAKRLQKRGGPLSFGRSQAKIYDRAKGSRVSFQDVAGIDEAVDEVKEVVDFLTNPDKYRSLGAQIPKGVLLIGPPGTGKTLLARAIAGEANVPFFSMSGSEFVEMFVGVGAARMRSLFEQAKERAPCIVFVDELDAIGKSRGGLGVMATNDEREQTLNQLLVEMDGFAPDTGVVIMAATNRPEVLDPALVRAGRFDRQILVDRPDVGGRIQILKVHARKVKVADDVDFDVIGRRTPGMVGADLANIVNEAALAAARRGVGRVGQRDFEESIDRVQLGLKKKNRVMNNEERRRVAVHEGGHALVAMAMKHADPVHRVTIIPRSIGALGATLQLPVEDRYLMTREELDDQLCVMLAGRAAEDLVCGTTSTGAENDLQRATQTARQMVCRFGMSELGPQAFDTSQQNRFLGPIFGAPETKNYSEQTAQRIDRAVDELLASQAARARTILEARRPVLERLTEELLEKETLDKADLEDLMAQTDLAPSRTRPTLEGAAS